jgi:porphyrinogen peroxidase
MFVGQPPGNYDRLLDFSRAITGTLFFVPSATFLEDVPPEVASPSLAKATANEDEAKENAKSRRSPSDGSLSLGSLKREPRHD